MAFTEFASSSNSSLLRICTLKAKWDEGSLEFAGTRPHCPAEVPSELVDRLNQIAVRAFEVFHLRDFGRVDFRVDAEGNPFVIDVNPNPDISPTAGFARATRAAGYDYRQTIAEISRLALARSREK